MIAAGLVPSALLAQQDKLGPKGAAAAPGPVPWMDGINHADPKALTVTADAIAESDLLLFTPQQMQALIRLADLFLPARNTFPSATEAGTPDFLDFLLSESSPRLQQIYLRGLDWLNTESQRKFATPFSKTTPQQADALVRPHLRTWMTDHPPTEPIADFINIAHEDMRVATYNSPAWSAAAEAAGKRAPEKNLYWLPVQPDIYTRKPQLFAHPHAAPTHKASHA